MIQITRIGGDPETEIKEARFQGASFPPHFNDTYSIGLITQGLEDITHEGMDKTVCKGKVVVFNAGEVHANRCQDDDPWSYRTLNVNEDRIIHIAAKNGIRVEERLDRPTMRW
jgi:quercetin dioxygenase-like cupin family protein